MPKIDALIGYTGFVGSNILSQRTFDLLYNSANIAEIRGQKFKLVVCAGAPGLKWKANQNPEADLANIRMLMDNLSSISCAKFVLISTIDVFPQPLLGYDENFKIEENKLTAYGRHRHMLEEMAKQKFDSLVIRLPGIFGNGIKKNAIYDLMRGKPPGANPESLMQFYWLDHLWTDIKKALDENLKTLNIAAEPILFKDIVREIFNVKLPRPLTPPAHYDMRTIHSALWNKTIPYLLSKQETLQDLKTFLKK